MGADSSFANLTRNCLNPHKEAFEFTPQPSAARTQSVSQKERSVVSEKGPDCSTKDKLYEGMRFKKISSHFCADTDDTSVREEAGSEPISYRESEQGINKARL
jgi:hypothetical protein